MVCTSESEPSSKVKCCMLEERHSYYKFSPALTDSDNSLQDVVVVVEVGIQTKKVCSTFQCSNVPSFFRFVVEKDLC